MSDMRLASRSPTIQRWMERIPKPSARTIVLLGFAASLIVQLVMIRTRLGPTVVPDEVGYLTAARFLSGMDPSPIGPFSYYYPGYPLVIAPVEMLFNDPLTVYRVVLLVNALLTAVLIVPLYVVARRLLNLDERVSALVATVAAVYSPLLVYSTSAMSENLLPLLFVGLLAALWSLLHGPTAVRGVAVGAMSTALFATHPRSAAVIAVLIAVLVALVVTRRFPVLILIVVLTALTVGVGLTEFANRYIITEVYVTGAVDSTARISRQLGRLVDPVALSHAATKAIGQIWYVLVSTLGLGAAGAIRFFRMARRDGPLAKRVTALVAIVAPAAVILLASVFVAQGTRADYLVYGRYVDPFVVPLVLAGCVELVSSRERAVRVVVGYTVTSVVLLGLVVLLNEPGTFPDSAVPLVHIPGLLAFNVADTGLDPVLMTLVSLLVVAAVGLGGRWRPGAALTIALVFFLGSASVTINRTIQMWVGDGAAAAPLRYDIRDIDHLDAIALDSSSFSRLWALYQYWLPDVHFARFDPRKEPPPAEFVISSVSRFEGAKWGARIASTERDEDVALWVFPGVRQSELLAEGHLLPPADEPLPDTARYGMLELASPLMGSVSSGDPHQLRLRFSHTGAGSPWASAHRPDPPAWAASVRMEWWTDGSDALLAAKSLPLPQTVQPGEQVEGVYPIRAATADGQPLPPGRYELTIELLTEDGVPILSGDQGLVIPVTVT